MVFALWSPGIICMSHPTVAGTRSGVPARGLSKQVRAVSISRSDALAALVATTLLTSSCDVVRAQIVETRDLAEEALTAEQIRECLDQRLQEDDGLLFRTTRSSESFVGVLMMDLTQSPSRPVSVGIAIHDDEALLDAYEERARQDPEDTVARIRNAVVSYHGSFTGRLAEGRHWVWVCLDPH
jgi:hypothetical protein